MTIQPISAGLAPSAFENRGNTGVFDIVELSIAKPPITQIRMKKLRLDGLYTPISVTGLKMRWRGCSRLCQEFCVFEVNVKFKVVLLPTRKYFFISILLLFSTGFVQSAYFR
ncbi:MAG TPA: hypothetical protein VMV97_11535 [Sulfuriferula sp.]|nr:hypothetical protein [Sulfuriferula sp.]